MHPSLFEATAIWLHFLLDSLRVLTSLFARFWLCSDATGEESTSFYPSVIACVAILSLTRDNLLHPASKNMLFEFLRSLKMDKEVCAALRVFVVRFNNLSAATGASLGADQSDGVTATGDGDEVATGFLALEFMERSVKLSSA